MSLDFLEQRFNLRASRIFPEDDELRASEARALTAQRC
jgi:hypothetical protein